MVGLRLCLLICKPTAQMDPSQIYPKPRTGFRCFWGSFYRKAVVFDGKKLWNPAIPTPETNPMKMDVSQELFLAPPNCRESWKFPMTNPLKLKPTLKQPHVSLFGPRNCLSRRVFSAELSSMLLDRSDPTCHRGRKWPNTNLNMYSNCSMCTPKMSLFLCPCMFAS